MVKLRKIVCQTVPARPYVLCVCMCESVLYIPIGCLGLKTSRKKTQKNGRVLDSRKQFIFHFFPGAPYRQAPMNLKKGRKLTFWVASLRHCLHICVPGQREENVENTISVCFMAQLDTPLGLCVCVCVVHSGREILPLFPTSSFCLKNKRCEVCLKMIRRR